MPLALEGPAAELWPQLQELEAQDARLEQRAGEKGGRLIGGCFTSFFGAGFTFLALVEGAPGYTLLTLPVIAAGAGIAAPAFRRDPERLHAVDLDGPKLRAVVGVLKDLPGKAWVNLTLDARFFDTDRATRGPVEETEAVGAEHQSVTEYRHAWLSLETKEISLRVDRVVTRRLTILASLGGVGEGERSVEKDWARDQIQVAWPVSGNSDSAPEPPAPLELLELAREDGRMRAVLKTPGHTVTVSRYENTTGHELPIEDRLVQALAYTRMNVE